MRDDPDALDPTLATTYTGRVVFGLCDKLFDIDQHLNIVPQLATGYEWNDTHTLLIHLRQGVKFQDGTTMDADAVKTSLERHLTLEGRFRRSEISQIDHIEVVDPLTIRIVLKSPSAPLIAQLTDRAGMILAPTAGMKEGKDFAPIQCAAVRTISSNVLRRTTLRWRAFLTTGTPRRSTRPRHLYSAHARTRKSAGSMTRKLSVTWSQ